MHEARVDMKSILYRWMSMDTYVVICIGALVLRDTENQVIDTCSFEPLVLLTKQTLYGVISQNDIWKCSEAINDKQGLIKHENSLLAYMNLEKGVWAMYILGLHKVKNCDFKCKKSLQPRMTSSPILYGTSDMCVNRKKF